MAGIQRDADGREVYSSDTGLTTAQVQALVTQTMQPTISDYTAFKASIGTLPTPATDAPLAEKTGAAVGAMPTVYARGDHQHPRLTSTTYATLDATGGTSVVFTRTFINKPGVVLTETDSTNSQPLVLKVESFTQAAGLYTGCVVRGYRAQALPTINALSGALTLVTQLITGVNAMIAQLTGYNVFGGSAAGSTVSVVAIARSDVAAT